MVLEWLVQHAGMTYTRFQVGSDGKTAFERLKGKRHKGEFLEFGSSVFHRVPEKPQGGFRPIGVFTSLHRLWMEARRGLCLQWEVQNDRKLFAMSKGRRVSDPVYRQALRQEAATTSSKGHVRQGAHTLEATTSFSGTITTSSATS